MEIVFKIGEWCASKIFDKVFEKLMENGIERCKSEFGVDPRVLEKALPMIQAMAAAAEGGMIMQDGGPLKEWLSQIVNISGEAENVLDEIEYHTLKEKVEMGNKHKVSKTALIASPSTELAKRAFCKGSTSERLKKVIKEINEVVAKADLFINLVDIRKQRQEQQKPSSINNRETSSFLSTEVFGREKEKEDLIRKLLNSSKSDDNKFSILPIVGVGGVGKTTLAKLVYNDEKVIEKHFPLKRWVCVSDCFDVTLITQKMLDHATGTKNSLSLAALQEKLKEIVQSKRFLLVLDDVWYDEDNCGSRWLELFAPLRYAASGSMIVLTTRKETVVAKLPMSSLELKFLKGIEKEKYWELFKVCAFGDRNPDDYNDLQCIGQEIAKKLKGSPLAAKTIGGILRDDLSPEHWKNILEKDMWAIKQGENDIMPALRLSYQHLDALLKPCFRFCSIFPQDHIFRKEKLVQMWIAVGLVQQPKNDNRRLEDIGEEYLDSLVRKSFFDYYNNIFEKYVMHDLMHELALAVSVGECSSVDTTGDNLKMVPDTVRHLSINIITNHLINPVTSHLGNLRTLILFVDAKDPQLPTVIGELLKGLKSLRILDFIDIFGRNYYSNIKIGQIHNNISELIHLRYLDATFVDIMQILSFKLYQLQVLVMPKVEEDKKLDWANNLISLRHLNTNNNYAANTIPNIGKLTSLQELLQFRVQKESGYEMNQLKDMNELRELGICNLENVESYEEATEANIMGKVHLDYLKLAWKSLDDQEYFEERVVNHLQPPKSLKNLVIDGYSGASFPCWLTKIEYASNLVSISLSNCKRWDSLPPFEKLPLLKSLKMDKMAAVKALGFPADWKDDEVCDFPSRQVQDLFEMPEKREELWNTEEGIRQWKWFQSLSELNVSNCHNMKRMPRLPLHLTDLCICRNEALISLPELYPPTLCELYITDCPNLTSLPHSLLWNPERFTALGELTILGTTNLIQLPMGGFSKLVNLSSLTIGECPKLERSSTSIMESKRLLPSSLERLSMNGGCGINVETSLLESLNGLTSLTYLDIYGCNNITALPPVDDFKSLISLISLTIWDCRELVSLGGLQANVSLKYLEIRGCNKLITSVDQLIPTNSSDVNWRNEVEDSSSSTKADSTPLIQDSTLSLEKLTIDSPLFLQTKHLQSAKVRCLIIEDHPLLFESLPDQLESLPEQWLMQRCNSLEQLSIYGAKALRSLPATLQTLRSLEVFTLTGATDLQSLPKMPPSLEHLWIRDCNPFLEKSCEKDVGPDWPNIAHVRCIEWD